MHSTHAAEAVMTVPTVDTAARGVGRRLRLRWLVVLVTGVALYAMVYAVLRGTGNPLYVPSLLLLGAAVVPVTFTTLIQDLQLQLRISLTQIISAAVLGGVVGTVIAGQLEFEAVRHFGALPAPLVGLIEESAKLAVLVGMLAWKRPRALDGLVLGVAVGSGFAALETMGYGFVTLLQDGGHLQPVTDVLMLRALASPGGHAAWTGLAAAAFFPADGMRRRRRGWLRFLLVFTSVVFLHSIWDATAGGHGYLLVAVVSFVTLLVVTWRLHRAQRSSVVLNNQASLKPCIA
jgi:protease PrsW